jgi:hypothetical protein
MGDYEIKKETEFEDTKTDTEEELGRCRRQG